MDCRRRFGSQQNLRPGSSNAQAGFGPLSKLRKSSVRSGISPSPSASSRGFVAHVEQLKMVLSGQLPPSTMATAPSVRRDEEDSGSDSMVSYEFTPSELSFNPPTQPTQPENGDAGRVPGCSEAYRPRIGRTACLDR